MATLNHVMNAKSMPYTRMLILSSPVARVEQPSVPATEPSITGRMGENPVSVSSLIEISFITTKLKKGVFWPAHETRYDMMIFSSCRGGGVDKLRYE